MTTDQTPAYNHAAHELELIAANDSGQHARVQWAFGTLARHWVANRFDLDLGIKAMRHIVDAIAKDQVGPFTRVTDAFPVASRNAAAESLARQFVDTVRTPECWGDLGERAEQVLTRAAAKAAAAAQAR